DRRQRRRVGRAGSLHPAVSLRDDHHARGFRVFLAVRAHPGPGCDRVLDRPPTALWLSHRERLDAGRGKWRRSVVRSNRRLSGRRGASVPPAATAKRAAIASDKRAPAPEKRPPVAPEKRTPIIDGVPTRMRLDRLLVEKGLLEAREKALRAIMAGDVLVDGQRADKAGALVSTEAEIEVEGRSPHASPGGDKLAHAPHHLRP